MKKRLKPIDVAHRRIVELIELRDGKGQIWAHGKRFDVTYDDLLDVVQAVEMVMLKLTGKVLHPKLRPVIVSRAGLKVDHFFVGDYSLYDGAQGAAPFDAHQVCDVTQRLLTTHYMHCEIDGNRWDTWFCRLDELVKALYLTVTEAQGDVYDPRPMVETRRGTQVSEAVAGAFVSPQVGHG